MWQKSWTKLLALQLQWFIDDEQNSIVCKHCLCRSPVPDPWETGIIGSKLLELNLLYKERIWNESICAYVYLCVCLFRCEMVSDSSHNGKMVSLIQCKLTCHIARMNSKKRDKQLRRIQAKLWNILAATTRKWRQNLPNQCGRIR